MKNVRDYNVGKSDYAKHTIQPWDIWKEYNLNPWDADIVKRILRTKEGEARRLEYEKIIHICKERIRQIDAAEEKNEPEVRAKNKPDPDEFDGTTVFCLSEENKPIYAADGHYFRVYTVFKDRGRWYAYVGYSAQNSSHMYISLTGTEFSLSALSAFPLPVILTNNRLFGVEHKASVKIGALGIKYDKYDYLINNGKLYRFMGCDDESKLFKYAMFMIGNGIEFIEIPYRLQNFAKQVPCKK